MTDLEKFTQGYIECALWCGVEIFDGGREAGDVFTNDVRAFTDDDLTVRARRHLRSDAREFFRSNRKLIKASGLTMERAGHDFWLTRNKHGAGYWDEGSCDEHAARALADLTRLSHAWGGDTLVLSRRGKIRVW